VFVARAHPHKRRQTPQFRGFNSIYSSVAYLWQVPWTAAGAPEDTEALGHQPVIGPGRMRCSFCPTGVASCPLNVAGAGHDADHTKNSELSVCEQRERLLRESRDAIRQTIRMHDMPDADAALKAWHKGQKSFEAAHGKPLLEQLQHNPPVSSLRRMGYHIRV
jgi:hypothetical protein